MGVYYSTYLGPYIVAPNSTISRDISKSGCPSCKVEHTHRFCPRCGSPRGSFLQSHDSPSVDSHELSMSMDEAMCTVDACGSPLREGVDIWIPNHHLEGKERELTFRRRRVPRPSTLSSSSLRWNCSTSNSHPRSWSWSKPMAQWNSSGAWSWGLIEF